MATFVRRKRKIVIIIIIILSHPVIIVQLIIKGMITFILYATQSPSNKTHSSTPFICRFLTHQTNYISVLYSFLGSFNQWIWKWVFLLSNHHVSHSHTQTHSSLSLSLKQIWNDDGSKIIMFDFVSIFFSTILLCTISTTQMQKTIDQAYIAITNAREWWLLFNIFLLFIIAIS